jgi:hypothetical protein
LILFWALVLHLIVSVVLILNLPPLRATRLSRVYKTYLLPGPFFTNSRIVNNYSLSISWKVKGKWMPPINPTNKDFNLYHTNLNPSHFYRSRMNRRLLYLKVTQSDSSSTDIKNTKEFHKLQQYLFDHYVPEETDSIRMLIIHKQTEHFMLRTDSVSILIPR